MKYFHKLYCCLLIALGFAGTGFGNSVTTITAISSSVCYRGDLVTFSGANLSAISGIRLNNTIIGLSYIKGAYPGYFELEIPRVPPGNYAVVITTPGGIVTAPGMLVITVNSAILPAFTSVNPPHVEAGSYVTVTGNNLLSLTGITIGIFHADLNTLSTIDGSSFAIQIPNIAQGIYQLTGINEEGTGYGIAVSIDGPNLVSASPAANEIDKIITVTGTRLYAVNTVTFGSVHADMNTFTKISDEQFSIAVPYVSQIGLYTIVAYTAYDHTNALNFSVSGLNIPFINQVLPATAAIADRITLEGGNLTHITGITFGATLADPATIFSTDETSFSVLVPFIPTGENDIVVYTKRGSSSPFFFSIPDPQPSITGFAPDSVKIGDVLSITGSNLGSTKALIINNFTTTGITILSQESITAVVPNGASTGMVSLSTLYGVVNASNILAVDTVTTIREVATSSGVSLNVSAKKNVPVIFPNPSSGLFYLANYPGNSLDVTVINNIGEQVYTTRVIKSDAVVDLSHVADGIYILLLKSETGQEYKQKLLLMKSFTK